MKEINLKEFVGFDEELIVDTSESTRSYLIIGKNGSRTRLSPSAYRLLQAVASGLSLAELASRLNEVTGRAEVSEEQLTKAYDDLTSRLYKAEVNAGMRKSPFGFWFKLCLIPERLVVKISSVLATLYEPRIAISLIAATGVAIVLALRKGFALGLNDHAWVPGYALFLGILIVHELGHAASCVRYGVIPSDIGFTVYLIYPAFYSDVSSCWQLKRMQRVVVDLGGNYFQMLATGCLLAAFCITRWQSIQFAITMSVYAMLFSLNPIFKFDGYWVLTDVLGVTNVWPQSVRMLKYFVGRTLKVPQSPLPWPMWVACVLVVYAASAIFVWASFLALLLPVAVHEFITLLHEISAVMMAVTARRFPGWSDINVLCFSIVFNIVSAFALWTIVKQIIVALIMDGRSVCKFWATKWSRATSAT